MESEKQFDKSTACKKKTTLKVCPWKHPVHSGNQRGARRLEKHTLVFLPGQGEKKKKKKGRQIMMQEEDRAALRRKAAIFGNS